MSIFERAGRFEHLKEAAGREVHSTLHEGLIGLSHMSKMSTEIIQQMRSAKQELPAGFPKLNDLVEAVGLNPQPLPPGPDDHRELARKLPRHGDLVLLNPQPLPPGPDDYRQLLRDLARQEEEVGLNLQPLPPSPDDYIGLMQRLGLEVQRQLT